MKRIGDDYSLTNSLFVQRGQGGILSYSSTVTCCEQLVQIYVPLPGFSPVFMM